MVFLDQTNAPVSSTGTITVQPYCPSAIDTVLIFDRTGSMTNKDVPDAPSLSRLQVSKNAGTNFLGYLKLPVSGDVVDRVSVIAFPRLPNGTSNDASTVTNMIYKISNTYFGTNYQRSRTPSRASRMGRARPCTIHLCRRLIPTLRIFTIPRLIAQIGLQVVIFLTDGRLLSRRSMGAPVQIPAIATTGGLPSTLLAC